MKYFTRDLHLAMQHPGDAEASAADAAWERAVDAYEARLSALRPSLPSSVLQLLDGHLLHDARVLGTGAPSGRFVLTIRLDAPPHEVLTIAYTLTAPAVWRRVSFAGMPDGAPPLWLYDEVEAGPDGFVHSVLFSNGWELDVPFREVEVLSASPVLPPVPGLAPVAVT